MQILYTKKIIGLISFFLLMQVFSYSQTWNGATSTDWNTATNWTPNTIPAAASNVIIPGGTPMYPQLSNDVSINNINMQAGSQLDVNGFAFTVTNANPTYTYFTGATLNNSDAGTGIVLNINTGAGGYYVAFDNTTVNDDITFNLTGSNVFYEAAAVATANIFNGNVTFECGISNSLFISSNGSASAFNGSLTVNRTEAGNTTLFSAGATITGNFAYTNNTAGLSSLGTTAVQTSIGGTVNITANDAIGYTFAILRLINQTTGGTINIQNAIGFNIQNDTLKVNSLSVTGYKTGDYGYFNNNFITGDVTLADDATYSGGYYTEIYSNVITGNSSFTVNGTNTLYESDVALTANTYNGNAVFTANNSGTLSVSIGSASVFNGNLTVTRTAAGTTSLFGVGATITGNFAYTNNTGGASTLGNSTGLKTAIAGTVNIAANYTTSNNFAILYLTNQTAGGTIDIQNTTGFKIQNDTLKINSLSVTDYKTGDYGYFTSNSITGNVTIADDATYTGGYYTEIYSNVITGNSSFTVNGTNSLFESDVALTANTYNGNAVYTANNSGGLIVSTGSASVFNGNVTVTRTAAGTTSLFGVGATITGNFAYTNNTGGGSTLGNSTGLKTSIAGTINIAADYITDNNFAILYLTNQTAGGTIDIQNTTGFKIQNDTLKINSLSVTDYKTGDYGYFTSNSITGNVTIADDATYTGGYYTEVYNNLITGNSNFTNNGTNTFYDADVANTGNKYIGNVTYIKNGGPMSVAAGSIDEIAGNLALNSTSGITLGNIKFNGSTDGVVEELGTQAIIIPQLTIEKTGTGKITLNDSVTVSGLLTFNGGNIFSSTINNLIFLNGATHTGASDASYVDGPVTKTGNQAFTFPVGQINKIAQISISAPADITDAFRAQYIHHIPADDGYDSTQRDPTLDHISRNEYWLLDRTAGASAVAVTLSWSTARSGIVNSLPDLRVTRWNGTLWKDEGNGGTLGTTDDGTIQSAGAISSFSPFTLASVTPLNPLPVTLINFNVSKAGTTAALTWKTADEVNLKNFGIERSTDGRSFAPIGKIAASGIEAYKFIDALPLLSKNYYRLVLNDNDNKHTYSYVQWLDFSKPNLFKISPNPAANFINISANSVINELQIINMNGQVVKKWIQLSANMPLDIRDLLNGIYTIKILSEGKVETSSFLKSK